MKFFLDTANLEQIKEAVSWGVIEGVTTNPTLISKENMEFEELIKKICEIVPGPVSVEVISQEWKGMVEEAKKFAELAENVVIKIPMTVDGLKATRELSRKNIKVNMTLIFSPSQALLAAKAGASFISPFIGRLDDISTPGMNLIEDIITIFNNYMFDTEIIVASIRHPLHVVEAALLGAHIATMPFQVLEKLVNHPLTNIGLERFLKDWEKVKK
ncbi:fructose-6-phosphate aldolase [Candidatus Aminicenantes bacterium AC-708-M15]|jgi:transaldolase|nr:fructose-6-phosphate aldolase [SCandidatus Aminicenantes bacterium Aminicenantia_JdfR_composite]MCP2597163.1 fructose-6-phosphate aldolase [Candidatus Aminicenantes bacterium AC-335-G13]MCP2598707.1 fructose-6-phosphate aldolase [Candidatus Aminicenantes bacterium AC-335-L06]MCP2604436.1 fructose-6-phosphate aldolase [Candidatus Aminicenantes bacterium AC-708-M15]MCP2618933.1 fructose-6-phosphate aldolase [Candidatus Aminicenantes bacterium AC-335-A11]